MYRVSKLHTSIGSIVSTLTHKVFNPPEEIYEHRLQGKVLEVYKIGVGIKGLLWAVFRHQTFVDARPFWSAVVGLPHKLQKGIQERSEPIVEVFL